MEPIPTVGSGLRNRRMEKNSGLRGRTSASITRLNKRNKKLLRGHPGPRLLLGTIQIDRFQIKRRDRRSPSNAEERDFDCRFAMSTYGRISSVTEGLDPRPLLDINLPCGWRCPVSRPAMAGLGQSSRCTRRLGPATVDPGCVKTRASADWPAVIHFTCADESWGGG
jgi:hypothetical protein